MDILTRVMQDAGFAARYEIKEVLGTGGMGVVHRAMHRSLLRPVAIKFMREELLIDEGLKARFLEEARAAATLFHSNITAVLDAGFAGPIPFLVTELVPGEPLSKLIGKRRWSGADVVECVRQMLAGLSAIHRMGVVHRDIKPTNLVVDEGPPLAVKILDFGLAKRTEGSGPATVSGVVLGTPAYMAPEQALQDPVSPATDLYAVAVVLFEILTGHTPFSAPTVMDLLHKQLHEPPPIPASLPAPVRELLVRGLAKRPADRFASGAEFAAALERAAGAMPGAAMIAGKSVSSPRVHMETAQLDAPTVAHVRVESGSAKVHVSAPLAPTPARVTSGPLATPMGRLWCGEPAAFARQFRELSVAQPNLRLLVRDLARFAAVHADTVTPERALAAFQGLTALAAVTQGHTLVPFKFRVRAVGLATWLLTKSCALATGPAAPPVKAWPGGGPLGAALEAGEAGPAGDLMRAGVSDRTTQMEAVSSLLSVLALDLAGEGRKFLAAHRIAELVTSGAWQGAEEALVIAARGACASLRDDAPAKAQARWLAQHRDELAKLAREGGGPAAAELAAVEEALREGGDAALDAILAAARTSAGWKAAWESVLLPFSRLMLRTGPLAADLTATAFSYLVALRASSPQLLRGDARLQAALLAVPLMARALKAAAAERAAPATRASPAPESLDAALDAGDPEAARAQLTELLASFREEPALEALGRCAAMNVEPAGYATRMSHLLAAAKSYEDPAVPGRERHLLALATHLARAARDAGIGAELQRAGV